MKIAITGASGFIGKRLSQRLTAAGHAVEPIARGAGAPAAGCDAVIHLAGEPVAQRWSAEVKRRIRESRSLGTRALVESIGRLGDAVRPRILVSASAVGFYGDRGDEVLTESSAPGRGFLPDVCVEWEREAKAAEALGVRVAHVRIGLVLGPGGGALAQMVTPFRFGVGGRLGDGKQWMPWVHLDDLCGLFEFALANPVHGALNGVAPNPVTNAEFTRALAAAVNRPAILPVPRFAMDLLFGEMSQILFASQRVQPRAAEAAGFHFQHREAGPAVANVLR